MRNHVPPFRLVKALDLFALASFHSLGLLTQSDVQVFFALQELLAGKEAKARTLKRSHNIDPSEDPLDDGDISKGISRLTLLSLDQCTKSLSQLNSVSLGLEIADVVGQERVEAWERAIQNFEELSKGRSLSRKVPIPRAFLKVLCSRPLSTSRTLVAIAYLIRGLALHKDGTLRCSGRMKAKWVCEAFGISERSVREARCYWIASGLIVISNKCETREK